MRPAEDETQALGYDALDLSLQIGMVMIQGQ